MMETSREATVSVFAICLGSVCLHQSHRVASSSSVGDDQEIRVVVVSYFTAQAKTLLEELRFGQSQGMLASQSTSLTNPLDSSHKSAELEEIALAEADVARLKQRVAELHHQLNQQRTHQFGSLPDICDRRVLQQDFDSTLADYNQERSQRKEVLNLFFEMSTFFHHLRCVIA
ncbi:hypothetical protein Droror1_Dr00002257 [Drosera rotundifolia]